MTTDPDQMITEDSAGSNAGQWFQLQVPVYNDYDTTDPNSHQVTHHHDTVGEHTMHVGKPAMNSQGPEFGWPGFTFDTPALFFVNSGVGTVMQTGGTALYQSVGDWTQISKGNVNVFGVGGVNVGSSGGLVLASIGNGPQDTQTVSSTVDANGDAPSVSTHDDFVKARNGMYDSMSKANNWFTFAMTAIVGIKQLMSMSRFSLKTFDGWMSMIQGLTTLTTMVTAGVTAGENYNTFGAPAPAPSSSAPDADPWADSASYTSAGNAQIGALTAWMGGGGNIAGVAANALKPEDAPAVRDALQKRVTDAQTELTNAEKATPRDQAKIDAARRKLENAQADATASDPAALEKAKTDAQAARDRATQSTTDLNNAKQQQRDANTRLTTATGERDALKRQRDSANQRLSDWDRREPPADDPTHASWQSQHDSMVSTRDGLETRLNAKEQEVTRLTTARDEANGRVTQAEQTEHTAKDEATAKEQARDRAQQVKDHPEQRAAAREANDNLNTARTEHENAQRALAEHEANGDRTAPNYETERQRLQTEADTKATHLTEARTAAERENGVTENLRSASAEEPHAGVGSKAMSGAGTALGAAAAGFGLYNAIKQSDTPSGIGMISDNNLFFATESSYGAVALGGFNFCAPQLAGFNVMTGGGFAFQSLLQGQMFSLQGLSIEGGLSNELTAGGEVKVASRRRAVKVAAKTIEIGAQVQDVALLGALSQLPTNEVKITAIDTGSIEISVGQTHKVTVGPTGIKLTYLLDSIELGSAGIKISSSSKVAIDAPMIELKADAAVKVNGMKVQIAGDVSAEMGGGGSKLMAVSGMLKGDAGGAFKIIGKNIQAG